MNYFLHHIERCNSYNPHQFTPFLVDGIQYGWIDNNFAKQLRCFEGVFLFKNGTVTLNDDLNTPEKRSKACAEVTEKLHQSGVIDSWVGELYAVNHAFNEQPVFLIERAAVSYFGIRGYGVHVNGLVQKSDGLYIWIARRTKDKPFWPGQLDQMVAGGQPSGIGRLENVIKESAEEANIPQSMAEKAELVSTIHYRGASSRGMSVDTLFNYDLYLPEDFIPENTDGEVDEFILMSIEEMAHITASSDQFKDNCNLVNIDLLIRLGLLNDSHLDFNEIKNKLYLPVNATN